MSALFVLLGHELRLQARRKAEAATLALYFIIVVVLLPFAIGPEPDLLRRLAPGLIWLAALLMSFLALDRLFVADARDGTLDVMLLSPIPLALQIALKLLTQSAALLAALVVIAPLAALLLNMPFTMLPVLLLSLLLGVPSLTLLGGIAGAITASLHRSPALLTLLLMPFYIPILIFGVSACDAASQGVSPRAALLFLGAILAVLLPTAPFVAAAALRSSQES